MQEQHARANRSTVPGGPGGGGLSRIRWICRSVIWTVTTPGGGVPVASAMTDAGALSARKPLVKRARRLGSGSWTAAAPIMTANLRRRELEFDDLSLDSILPASTNLMGCHGTAGASLSSPSA